MVAEPPSLITMAPPPVPPPPSKVMMLSLTVTLAAWMLRLPEMRWQLMTVFGVVIDMVLVTPLPA